jgi:hypothetical protein
MPVKCHFANRSGAKSLPRSSSVPGNERSIGAAVSDGLFGINQFTPRPIDGIFEFVAAAFAQPHVSNAVIGKVLGPLGSDQNRTTLRALAS